MSLFEQILTKFKKSNKIIVKSIKDGKINENKIY